MRGSGEKRSTGGHSKWIALTVAIGVAMLVATIYVYSRDDVDELASGLLAFIFAAVGICFTYLVGVRAAEEQAHRIVHVHAKKSIRRILNLVAGLHDFSNGLDRLREQSANPDRDGQDIELVCDLLQQNLGGQLRTAENAVDDWGDIVPDQVADILSASDDQVEASG